MRINIPRKNGRERVESAMEEFRRRQRIETRTLFDCVVVETDQDGSETASTAEVILYTDNGIIVEARVQYLPRYCTRLKRTLGSTKRWPR